MSTIPVWLAVAAGGALGSVLRHAAGVAALRLGSAWPWATWTVNLIGSLLIGLLVAMFLARPVPDALRVGLVTGVLGGFTTFSAFSLETLSLLERYGLPAASGYVAATLAAGLAACALGLWIGRSLFA